MTGFDSIPPELIEYTCHQLDALSVVRLAQVSRQFWRIFQSSALRYKVQLEVAGMRDIRSGKAGSAARLDMLKAHQAVWANFACARSAKTTVDMSGEGFWELVGNVLATYTSETGFVFQRIPSAVRHIPSTEWSIPNVPFAVGNFSMDPSQDLLLVVETNPSSAAVHLLSLKTGIPHPLARNPRLETFLESGPLSPPRHFQIRIFREYIGVMVQDDDENDGVQLLVWEWKSGLIKKHLYTDGNDLTSFAFLDNHMLLIGAFVDCHPELKVVDIEEGPQTDGSACFSFRLPTLSRYAWADYVIDMTIQTEPPPSWTSVSRPDEPFTICHSDRLFVVSLRVWDDTIEGAEPSFMLCVRLSTLLNLMENPPVGTKNLTIPWEQWGPSRTRMLRVPRLPDPWVCFVYGQRCVIQTTPTRCQILDFNPLSTVGTRILHEKAVDKRWRLFDNPVKTSAPFTLVSVDISPSTAVMLAEDGIVTVSPDEDLCTIFSV